MPLDLKVIHIKEFLRMNPAGEFDLDDPVARDEPVQIKTTRTLAPCSRMLIHDDIQGVVRSKCETSATGVTGLAILEEVQRGQPE